MRVGQSWGDRISDTLDGRPLVDRPVADPVEMTAEVVMATYSNGNGNRWTDELDWLWRIDREQMLSLLDDVMDNGIRNPIVAGSDGRLWDGHRRVAVAAALQIPLMVQVIKGD
ncbi:ParB-like nuclease domain protein [Mycobacterium phage Hilltopfarm]|nr:ParB-like nuclease domain protein [Mycobacterium phage Hilltopfarm]